jgi:hypothetical protein
MIAIWPETAKPPRFAPEMGSAGSQPAADRFTFSPDQDRNVLERRAKRFQPCGFLIARLPARLGTLTALLGRCWFGGIGWGGGYTVRWHDRLFGDLLGNLPTLDMLTIDDGSNSITEVAQQVPHHPETKPPPRLASIGTLLAERLPDRGSRQRITCRRCQGEQLRGHWV